MRRFDYIIRDELGIHARPAGILAKEAKRYDCRIVLIKDGKRAEAQKMMDVMALEAEKGAHVEVEISGSDEEAAWEGMRRLFEDNIF